MIKALHVWRDGGIVEQSDTGYRHLGQMAPQEITDMAVMLAEAGWQFSDWGSWWRATAPQVEQMLYQFEIQSCYRCRGKGSVAVYDKPTEWIPCPICGGDGAQYDQIVEVQ